MMKTRYFLYSLLAVITLTMTSCGDDDEKVKTAPAPDATGTWTDDRDQTEYGWVRYGNLEWTTENLRFKPAEGVTLPDLTPVNPLYYNDGVAAKYYEAFGFLYDYEAALAAVPEGWRLPTNSDWADLDARCGGDIKGAVKLLLGGYQRNDDYAQQIHGIDYYTYEYGYYWSADIDESKPEENFAYYRKLVYNQAGSTQSSMDKTNYLSVRLVRDAQ